MTGHETEMVNLRIIATGLLSKPGMNKSPLQGRDPKRAMKGHRSAYINDRFIDVPIYERTLLQPGNHTPGPCIIEQLDSTTVILDGYDGQIDEYNNIIISREGS